MYAHDSIEMQLLRLAVAIIFINISSNFRTSDEFEFLEFFSILHKKYGRLCPSLYVTANNRKF